jgi:integrase
MQSQNENEQSWREFVKAHPSVESWLKNRPYNTARMFGRILRDFSEYAKITPDEWRALDRFKARDLAWNYSQTYLPEHSAEGKNVLLALKSFYRNNNGEQLPFDSGRGGKHYFKREYKKASYEHIPNKAEVYAIIDMANSLRNKALLLFLFQAGPRVNVIEHIKYGHVKNELKNEILTVKVTDKLDDKLKSLGIPYYYTFLNGEGAATLRKYCEEEHSDGDPDKPLFLTNTGTSVTRPYILRMLKSCIRRAGFDPNTMWIHSLRKAFRKIVRQAPDVDDDDREQLMGHSIRGSRSAYYDKNDIPIMMGVYRKCNFSRVSAFTEVAKVKIETEDVKRENQELKQRLEEAEKMIQQIQKSLKSLAET